MIQLCFATNFTESNTYNTSELKGESKKGAGFDAQVCQS